MTSRQSSLDYEIAQEQAPTLGGLGRSLEASLVALCAHGRAQADGKATAVRARSVRDG
jgi:hypothetical protein